MTTPITQSVATIHEQQLNNPLKIGQSKLQEHTLLAQKTRLIIVVNKCPALGQAHFPSTDKTSISNNNSAFGGIVKLC